MCAAAYGAPSCAAVLLASLWATWWWWWGVIVRCASNPQVCYPNDGTAGTPCLTRSAGLVLLQDAAVWVLCGVLLTAFVWLHVCQRVIVWSACRDDCGLGM